MSLSSDERRVDDLVDSLTVPEPEPKRKGFEESMREEVEASEILERCGKVRGLTVCEEDEVLIRVGRYWWHGIVRGIDKLGVVIENEAHLTAIALGKIATITIMRRGKWWEKYKMLKGARY